MAGLDDVAVAAVEIEFKGGVEPAKKLAKEKKAVPAAKVKKTAPAAKAVKETRTARETRTTKAKGKAAPPTAEMTGTTPVLKKQPRMTGRAAPKAAVPGPAERRATPPAAPKKALKGRPKLGPARPAAHPPRDIKEIIKGRKPKPPKRRPQVDVEAQQRAVRESVRRTLAKIDVTRRTKRRKTKSTDAALREIAPIRVPADATVQELATALEMSTADILAKCEELGLTVTVDHKLEQEVIELIVDHFGRTVEFEKEYGETQIAEAGRIIPERLVPRAPIVTVMGHVDHGKTSILDYIRRTNVATREAGGITQHIGASEVETESGKIVFIDTPGHEAFTAMRARGAKVTDIVVLVVAADDGVMPQTVEAINHTRASDVPMIVAINKMDVPAANPIQLKQQLAKQGVMVESFGGDIVDVEVSAKTGQGIDRLLEMIVLQGELLELMADPKVPAQGVVIEVKKEEGRGILCTVLIKQGTLKVGDAFVAGVHSGKVRALLDHLGKSIKQAAPSTPVLILGSSGLPEAGDSFNVVEAERGAREISFKRQEAQKDRERQVPKKLTLEQLYSQIQEGEIKEMNLLIKGDADGSVEALRDSLIHLGNDQVRVKILHAGVGSVTEYDVLLASSSNAIIVGFNVKIPAKVKEVAVREKVEIKNYSIIYECLAEINDAMNGLLEPEIVEKTLGRAVIRKVYKISKLGAIAGSYVIEGSIQRNAKVRVLRNDELVFEGRINSLKRFQDDMKEVQKDFECGIGVAGFNGFQEGDILEAFVTEEKERVI
jgi:translation initiation factor IF-2